MRQHGCYQIFNAPHLELEGFVRSIRSDGPAFPSLLDRVEDLGSVCILVDRKTRTNLPPEAMPLAGLERNAETAFAIHET